MLEKVEAERLVSFGAAEYVANELPVEQKEEKQPRQTKEDKTANKRRTK